MNLRERCRVRGSLPKALPFAKKPLTHHSSLIFRAALSRKGRGHNNKDRLYFLTQ
jgi:hypothetical protein